MAETGPGSEQGSKGAGTDAGAVGQNLGGPEPFTYLFRFGVEPHVLPIPSPEALLVEEVKDAGIVWISKVMYVPGAEPGTWVKLPRADMFLHPLSPLASISIRDHGFLYSCGVFEGINFCNVGGETGILFMKEHVNRFFEGAKQLRIEMPITQEEFEKVMLETVRESGLKAGYLRPVLTRGSGRMGLNAKCEDPVVAIYACQPLALFSEDQYKKGLNVCIADTTRISTSERNITNLKWLAYTVNIMAKMDAVEKGFDDALMLVRQTVEIRTDGDKVYETVMRYLSEATAANVFFVVDRDGREVLCTPSLRCNPLEGITRDAIIALAKAKGLEVDEGLYTKEELMQAKEVFETGTAAGVIAVTSIDGKKIGEGVEGKVTRMLRDAYFAEVVPASVTFMESHAEKAVQHITRKDPPGKERTSVPMRSG